MLARQDEGHSDRAARLALLGLALAAALSTIWLVHPWYEASGSTNDASIYLLCARSLLRGEGYAYLGQPMTLRPPGFSALLAPVLALRGFDFHALNLLVAATGVACVTLLAAFQRARTGLAVALALGAAAWLNPAFQAFCNRVMSDVPAAALLYGALLLERWAARKPSIRRDLALGLCIGLASYVRWSNAPLFLAVVCSRAARRWAAGERGGWGRFARERLAAVLIVPVLVIAPWWVRDAALQTDAPSDQTFVHSYGAAALREDASDPDSRPLTLRSASARIGAGAWRIACLVGARLDEDRAGGASGAIGAVLLVLALATAARRRGTADFMLIGLACASSLAPRLQDRHLLPIFLLAVPAAVDALAWIGGRLAPAKGVRVALALAVVALAAAEFRPRAGWKRIERRHAGFVAAARALEAQLPRDAVVAASVGWHLSVYLERPVYSLGPAITASGRVASAEAVIDRHRIDTVIAFGGGESDEFDRYFEKKYGPGSAVGSARVYRVRP